MPSPVYTADDYKAVLLALLPTGPVWPRDPDAVLPKVMAGLAPTYARNGARALVLLDDSPAGINLLERLPEWETTLGLPDPCAGADPTVALRRAHVQAKISYRGGQSIPYFVGLAAALGFVITVTEFAPSRFGQGFGNSFGGDAWAHTWRVNAPAQTVRPFLFGAGFFGEPFQSWGNTVLECTLNAIKPAHTVLQFSYS